MDENGPRNASAGVLPPVLLSRSIQSIATVQMIEERLHRNPRADKDRGTTEDVWIALVES